MYCAATAADCPFVAMKEKLVKMAAKKQCDGTVCPAGCCPEQNWFCCPDNMYCAATAADCPFVAMKEKLVKMAAKKQCDGNKWAVSSSSSTVHVVWAAEPILFGAASSW